MTWDLHINTTKDIELTTSHNKSRKIWDSQKTEGASHSSSTISAGISQCGRVNSMSRKMIDSVSQCNFYSNAHMHYMAAQLLMGETPQDLFCNLCLVLQKRMRNPIAFNIEIMGDI
jgi:hypothetical protein